MTDGVLDGLEVWSLDLDDLALVGNKTGATRLRFAVLLKFFESRARFPLDRAEVPVEAVASLAEQVGVEFGSLAGYDWSGRSWKRHRAQIRRRFGFRSWSQLEDAEPLVDWLVAGPLAAGLRGWPLETSAGQRCRERRVEPPAASTLSRLIGKAGSDRPRCGWTCWCTPMSVTCSRWYAANRGRHRWRRC